MSRAAAIAAAQAYFDEGRFTADLARRVAIPTESQVEERAPVLRAYLVDEIAPSFARLGFSSEIVDNPVNKTEARGGPMLIAERREPGAATTVFGYGHGDVIRGLEPQWHEGLSPWELKPVGERLYGRGTADNKGQHTINMAALDCVLQMRGRLGFNSVFLIETGVVRVITNTREGETYEELQEGELVGQTSLVTGKPFPATGFAVTDVTIRLAPFRG